MAEIEVLHPGIYTSIQDLGRFRFQKFGVPQSGVMDRYAMRICNLLLGNSENSAVLEITFQGPYLKFNSGTYIAISGADLSATINDKIANMNSVIEIKPGDILKFGKRRTGMRAYLAIRGGFKSESVMQSRSWYDEITEYSRFKKGMLLHFVPDLSKIATSNAAIKIRKDYLDSVNIEAYPGPEFQQLSKELQNELFNKRFTVDGTSNRMAILFEDNFENSLKAIITSPVMPGTVQLTPSGKLIVLMRDCQTTGGYPRVLQLSESGMECIAQKIPGTAVNFQKKEY